MYVCRESRAMSGDSPSRLWTGEAGVGRRMENASERLQRAIRGRGAVEDGLRRRGGLCVEKECKGRTVGRRCRR